MSETEVKDKVENQEENKEENKEEEQEEPVDLELQKEMKKAEIDEGMFGTVNKKEGNKKNKKSKGIDFNDYANKYNLQFDIQYEQNKVEYNKEKKYDNQHQNYKQNKYKKNYNQTGKTYNRQNNQHYNSYNKNYNNQRSLQKPGLNKFDVAGTYDQRIINEINKKYNVELTSDEDIINYMLYLFSIENLNSDTYIRSNLDNEGKIDMNYVTKYYGIKNNNITAEKLIELIPKIETLTLKKENDKTYIQINDFNNMNLISLEKIKQNKKIMKEHINQANMFPQMGMDTNQNIYYQFFYFPYQMPGYQPYPQYPPFDPNPSYSNKDFTNQLKNAQAP